MSCIALACQIERVLTQAEGRIVFEEIGQEGDKVLSCRAGVVHLISSIIVGKSDSNRLINAHEMTEEVPRPRIFHSLDISLGSLSVDRSNLVEAAELTWSSGSSLKPDDEWNRLVFPR